MVYGTQITIVTGAYKPTNITRGGHIVEICHARPPDHFLSLQIILVGTPHSLPGAASWRTVRLPVILGGFVLGHGKNAIPGEYPAW